MEDITKTGPRGHTQIQAENDIDFIEDLTPEMRESFINSPMPLRNILDYSKLNLSPRQEDVGNITSLYGFGHSKYDNEINSFQLLESLENIRSENQPWYDLIANSVAKGGVLAGTTFLSGTVGLVVGAGTSLVKWDISGLWDNGVTNILADINEYSEEKLANHRTDAEQEGPWYSNIFTANFLGESIIKNMGFMVGAFYSGGLASKAFAATGLATKAGTGALNAMNATNKVRANMGFKEILNVAGKAGKVPAHITSAVGASVAAVAEGSIEAINNSRQWYDAEKERIGLKRDGNVAKIKQDYSNYPEMVEKLIEEEKLAYDNSMAEAAMNRTKMGNMDLAFNLPVLWASGMTQFARQFSGGFKTARRANNIVGEAGKMVSKTGKVGHKIGRSALNSLAEGFEELGQETGNIISGTHYSHVNDSFYAQQLNPEAELEAVSLINSMSEGFKETMSKGESWEQFWVGAFSSALGMPMFGKKNNNQSWIGKNKAFGFTGGAIGEYQSLTQEAKDEQKIIDYVNNTINSGKGKEYYKGMIRSLAAEKRMEKAAADNDQYEYKNAEHNQLVSDITMFDNAGAIEDLLALVESSDLKSDELLDALITDLTVENEDGTFSGPFTDKQGNKQTDTKVNREKMKLKLNEKTEHIKQTIDDYLKIKDDLDVSTGLVLSNEQLSEIVWLKSQVLNWDKRAEDMGEVNKGLLTNLSESVSRRINYYDDYLVAMAKADQSNFTTEKELVDEELTGEEITAGAQPQKVDSKVVYFNGNKLSKSEVEDIGKIVEHLEQIEILDSWTKLSAVEMSDRLGNEELNNSLQNLFAKMVADGTSVVIEDAKTFKDNSQDLIKLHKSKAMYNQRLKQYLENPGLIAEAIVNKYQEELDNQIMEKVKNFPEVTTHAEFKAAIELMPDAMYGKVLENLLDSDNEILLKLAQDHENFTNGKIIFRTLFESDPNSERYNLISSGVIIAFENAETLEGALKLWADSKAELVNNDKELGVIYDELLTAFTEAKASLDKLNDDRNIARKTAKKKAAEAPKAKTGLAKGLENAVTGVSNVVTGTKNILAGKKYNAKGEDITDESSKDDTITDKDDTLIEEDDTLIEEDDTITDKEVDVETPVLEHDSFVASDPAVVPKNESKKAKKERFEREVKETETSNESPDLKQASNLTGFRSWNRETKYDFNSLSDKSTRKMKIYLEGRAITEKLDELGVQRFIDTGKLAALVDANPDTVIHYIKPKDSVYGDRILLAIEVTPETLRIAKSENAISANNTQYQVVGVLGFNGGVKGVAMNKLNAIVSHMMHEGTKSSDNYVVSSKYTNKVAHMYSGRMVKSTEAEGVSTKSVTRAFLDKGEGDAVPFRLGFYYKEGDFKTPGLDPQSGDKVESVNLHNANKKDGSLWLMVQEADGVWYPKYVGVKRFTEDEYNLAEHADKPLMAEIQEAIEIILDPQSNDAQRMTAKGIVERTLYWKNGTEGKSESFLRHNFNKKTGVVDLIVGDKAFVAQGETLSEQAMSVMTALQSDELNLRFQIHHGLMGESSYENKILDSEILTTDLHQPRNVNGSFDLFLNDPKTGAPIETDAPGNYGHSGRKSRQNSLDKKSVTSLGNRYLIDEKSGVVTNLKGEVIKDGKTLDHIRLSMLMSDPKVNPMRGSDLYMSNYTEGGELFGIIGKKLLTGQPLQDKLVEIKAKQDDMDRRAALKKEKAEAEKLKAHNYVKGYKVSDDGKTVVISANSAKGGTFLIHYSKDGGLTIVQNTFSEEGNAKPKINMSPNLTQLVIDKFVSPEVKALFEKYKNDLNNAEFKHELNKLDAASKLKLSDDGIPILPDPIPTTSVTPTKTIPQTLDEVTLDNIERRREDELKPLIEELRTLKEKYSIKKEFDNSEANNISSKYYQAIKLLTKSELESLIYNVETGQTAMNAIRFTFGKNKDFADFIESKEFNSVVNTSSFNRIGKELTKEIEQDLIDFLTGDKKVNIENFLKDKNIKLNTEYEIIDSEISDQLAVLSRRNKKLFKKILPFIKKINPKIIYTKDLRRGIAGEYRVDENVIYINIDAINKKNGLVKLAETILHESIHSITVYATHTVINKDNPAFKEAYELLTPAQINNANELLRILKDIQQNDSLKNEYGASDINELIAELSNENFVKKLGKTGFLSKIINAIRKIIGLPTDNYSALKDIMLSLASEVDESNVSALAKAAKKAINKLDDSILERVKYLEGKIAEINAKYDALRKEALLSKIELIDEDIALEEDKKRRELLDVPTNDYSEYSQQGLLELINSFHPNFIPSNSKLHYNNKIKTLINMGNNFNYSDKFDSDLIMQIRNYAGRLEKRLNNVVEKDLSRVDEITKRNDSKIESLKKEKASLLKLKEELLKEASTTQVKQTATVRTGKGYKIFHTVADANLTDAQINEAFNNYVNMMDRKREGKALSYDDFIKKVVPNMAYLEIGDTQIFGEWDSKNNIFKGRVMGSKSIRTLYEDIKSIQGSMNFMASVPADMGKMLDKAGFTKVVTGKPYNFKGEDMVKHLYFSKPELVEKVFGKKNEDVTLDDIVQYDSFFSKYRIIKEILEDIKLGAPVTNIALKLKELSIYDINAYNIIKRFKFNGYNDTQLLNAIGVYMLNGRDMDKINEVVKDEKTKSIILNIHKLLHNIDVASANKKVQIDTVTVPKIHNELNNELNKTLVQYLSKFGIKTELLEDIQNLLGIDTFATIDILNKILHVDKDNQQDLPQEAGKIIAYMMLYNPMISEISDLADKKGLFKGKISKLEKLDVIGDLIAEELHKQTSTELPTTLGGKIKLLIQQFKSFLNKSLMARLNRQVGYIAEQILLLNQSLITASVYKPGAFGKQTSKVSLESAMKKDKFGAVIINKLSEQGFLLTGSTALSEQGTILRPDENPLHDIDWASPFPRAETKRRFLESYPEALFIRDISSEDYTTDTYLIAPEGHTIQDLNLETIEVDGEKRILLNSYSVLNSKGEVVGTYKVEEGKETSTGVEGKSIDFFSKSSEQETKGLKSGSIGLSHWTDIFKAKLEFARYKDIWDYNRFIPNENKDGLESTQTNTPTLTPVAPIEVSEKMDEVVKGISELMDGKENLEIKTDVMNSIKDSVRPLHSKKTLTKAELIAILKKQLAEHVTITQEGEKFFISLKSTETVVPLDLNFTDRIATVEQTELQKQVEMEKQAREESERLKAEGNTRVAPTARNLKGIEPSESNKPSLMKTLTKMNTRKHSFLFRKFGVKDDIALMEAIKNHDKLVDPSTLTDQDSIDGLIETMMNCI